MGKYYIVSLDHYMTVTVTKDGKSGTATKYYGGEYSDTSRILATTVEVDLSSYVTSSKGWLQVKNESGTAVGDKIYSNNSNVKVTFDSHTFGSGSSAPSIQLTSFNYTTNKAYVTYNWSKASWFLDDDSNYYTTTGPGFQYLTAVCSTKYTGLQYTSPNPDNYSSLAKTGYKITKWSITSSSGTYEYEVSTSSKTNTFTFGGSGFALKPVYEANKYSWSFDLNGGSGSFEAKDQEYNSNWNLPDGTPTKSNYTFDGWSTIKDDATTKVTSSTKFTGTSTGTLYALWKGATLSVTFSHNYPDGSYGSTPTSQTYNSKYVLPTSPSKTGYTFNNWWTDPTNGTQVTTSTTVTSSNTVYAHWIADTRKVKYYKQSNLSELVTEGTVQYNKALSTATCGIPSNPTLTGYDFSSWSVSSSTLITSDTDIYGNWNPKDCYVSLVPGTGISTIYYRINGASSWSNTSSTLTIYPKYNSTVECYATPKAYYSNPTNYSPATKYSFTATALSSSSPERYTPSASEIRYTIKYNGNGNTGGILPSDKVIDIVKNNVGGYPSEIVGENDLKRTGYKVRDTYIWNSKEDGTGDGYKSTDYISFTDPSVLQKTIYAAWDPLTYNVTFDPNGGDDRGLPESLTVTYGKKYSNLPSGASVLYKQGYTFVTWYYMLNGVKYNVNSDTTVNITEDTVLTAEWRPNTYTVVYNGNGATSGSTASSSHTYDTPKNLTKNGYSRQYFYFEGWADSQAKANANQVDYLDEAEVMNLTATDNGTVNLYAVWARSKTISVKANNKWQILDLNTGVHVNVNGSWKQVPISQAYVNVDGTWKSIDIS